MPALTEKDENVLAWRYFQVAPLQALNNRSLMFRQSGTSGQGGPCIVAPDRHCDALGQKGASNVKVLVKYEQFTAVSALTVSLGGEGNIYWYPYVEKGVGECDIDYDANVGTIALTAGMNGCSLRIYVNPASRQIKFCHDNNGDYASDDAYAKKGYQHLQSINADKKMRGDPAQNINNYWDPIFDNPASGVYFICQKTAAMEWTIFQSVVRSDGLKRDVIPHWRGLSTIEETYKFSGRQEDNKEVVKVKIPSLPAPRGRSASINDLPVGIDNKTSPSP